MNEQTKRAGLSRRGFLGLGALAAAGSVMGLAGCAPQGQGAQAVAEEGSQGAAVDWLGAEPEIAAGDIVKTEDTGIHRKGPHLFIHMSNLEIFTLMVVQENFTSDVKVVFGWTSKVKLAKEEG